VSWLDSILNLAALLLWLNWRAINVASIGQSPPATLAGTIRRAEPLRVRPWHYLLALIALLIIRAWVYWQLGEYSGWMPSLRLGAVAAPFRPDFFSRALVYSVLSFGIVLACFYFWLLFLSAINGRSTDAGPVQKVVRLHLGPLDRWWWPLKVLIPFAAAILFWVCVSPLLASYNIVSSATVLQRVEQGAAIGLASYLSWQYLIYGVLLLYILTSYVYLGEHPLWGFLALTGRNVLAPLRSIPLRVGRVDLAPFFAIALTFVVAAFAQRKLTVLYSRLSF
jgi:uncharacterized protein YggT (Ycf19 family)